MMMKQKLLGMNPAELAEAAVKVGLKPFAGRQIAEWMYVRRVRSFNEMTNISKEGRARLGEAYDLGTAAPIEMLESVDGTRKYLFGYDSKSSVEAVTIPDKDRLTLCVSSQSGCRMGCRFCMTGRQGFHGNLSVADILNQFISVENSQALTNAVFMGMGEPLDNYSNVMKAIEVLTAPWGFAWSPKRITVSSIGVLPNLRRFLDESRCHLAISLHNPFSEERLSMMPVQKAWPIEDIICLLKEYDFSGQRRVSFEYTMFAGFNDDKVHADAISRLLKGLECRVNLIRFHKIPDFPYEESPQVIIEAFQNRLNRQGITCTIRASRGQDILAACGLLAGKHVTL